VADYTRRAANGEAILLFGGSEAVSSFCYVTDTVKGLQRIMAAGDEQPVNIGSDQPVRVMELAQMVMALVGAEVEVVIRSDYTDGHRAHLVPDITRAKETLSWFPVTLLKDGLKRTVEDLRASRGLVHPAA
jgi:nucleoside-diphosphate-sugar epimerase